MDMKLGEQISMFDGNHKFKFMKPIRLIELFGGIGAQAKALERLKVDFEHYKLCEIDKYAVKSYNAIHGTNFEPSDITKIHAADLEIIETDKYDYLITYSFPCQDLSTVGKQAGMAKGSGTRSGLLWEVERLLTEQRESGNGLPQVLLMENVPQLIGEKNIVHFSKWVEFLDGLGYKSKWALLNSNDFGIPQNRNRCFMISILGDYYYEFPQPKLLKLRLKDMLEDNVDEKYYLSKINTFGGGQKEPKIMEEPIIYDDYNGRIKADQSVIGTLTTNCGNDAERNGVKIIEPNLKTKMCNGLIEKGLVKYGDVIRHSYINSRMNGEMKDIKENNMCPTLDTRADCLGVVQDYRIRKLTPKECWRLMDFDDGDIDRAKAVGISDSQLYRQAGNSICVNVLVEIFRKMI